MSHIEYDPVPLRDRPVIHRLFAHHAKYVVGARAGVKHSGMKVVPDADSGGKCSHGVSPSLGCSFHAKDAPKFSAGGLAGLRWSLPDLLLSIEMNTKPALSAKNTIEFR